MLSNFGLRSLKIQLVCEQYFRRILNDHYKGCGEWKLFHGSAVKECKYPAHSQKTREITILRARF